MQIFSVYEWDQWTMVSEEAKVWETHKETLEFLTRVNDSQALFFYLSVLLLSSAQGSRTERNWVQLPVMFLHYDPAYPIATRV